MTQRKIGILVGREWSWPPAFIEEVNRRNVGVTAEFVKLGAPPLDEQIPYDVVVDRISHEVPFYRAWLKHAALQGVAVINNPFMWTADDKFFGATLAEANGIRSPKTMALPNKEYVPGIKHDESLRNLVYPLDWQGIVEYIGLPCILKDAHGGGWRDVYVCRSLEELVSAYDQSGLLTMIVQEFIEWDEFVRCVCVGRQHVMPIKYDPKARKYHDDDTFLAPDMRARIISQARTLVRALGYDMNSIEFAIKDGVPYAIDFMNPAPDFDINSLTPKYFEWAVGTMADFCIELALEPRQVPPPNAAHLFGGPVAKVTADPVRAWHDGLTESLALESAAWLTERQLERGIAFGERPLCTVLRPRLIRLDDYDFLRAVCTDLLGAFRTAGEAALNDREFRKQFHLADWEETLLQSAPRLHVTSPLGRLDAFIDPADGIPRITEYNGETPAGTAYCDALSELFLAMPAMRPFAKEWTVRPLPARNHLLNTLLDTWHQFRGVRTIPSIAIVDWHDVPTVSEFNLSRDYFQSMGCECIITTPDALTYEHGKLRDASGVVIDLIYKRVLIHELIEECGLEHPMVRAVVEGAVCMVNPFSCKPLHKKASLAVLSDERNAARFTAAQNAVIARHVPWTRVVEERHTAIDGAAIDLIPWIGDHKDDLVLKPNDDYGGTGIVLGWEVDNADWEIAVTRAIGEPYIVQRRIALPKEPFAAIIDGQLTLDERIVDTAPFCWDGSWADGMLCRISTSTLVNVTAGGGSTIPTFVVEPR